MLSNRRPLAVAASRPFFQSIFVAFALYELYRAIKNSAVVGQGGMFVPPPHTVRLTVLGLRDPALSPALANPFSFGLLRNGCPLLPTAESVNGTAIVSFGSPTVAANGYLLDIAGGASGQDPVRWIVHALSDLSNSSSWKVIGTSEWQGLDSEATLYTEFVYSMPLAAANSSRGDGMRVLVDGRVTWEWGLTYIGIYLVSFVGWTAFAASGCLGRQRAAKSIVICLFGTNALLLLASSVNQNVHGGSWRATAQNVAWGCVDLVTAALLWWDESRAVLTIFAYGALNHLFQVW